MRRGFELVSEYHDLGLLPKRATKGAAGYDFHSAIAITIPSGGVSLVPTGVKAYMQEDEVLMLFDRSSNYKKKGIVLVNSVGIIDHDYYNNATNEGQLFFQMKNVTNEPITINYGERVGQGVFTNYLKTDDDIVNAERIGGFGSTN